eukprot:2123687-Rhodomonas_salina.1
MAYFKEEQSVQRQTANHRPRMATTPDSSRHTPTGARVNDATTHHRQKLRSPYDVEKGATTCEPQIASPMLNSRKRRTLSCISSQYEAAPPPTESTDPQSTPTDEEAVDATTQAYKQLSLQHTEAKDDDKIEKMHQARLRYNAW